MVKSIPEIIKWHISGNAPKNQISMFLQFTYLKKRYFVIFCQTFLWSQKILLLTEVPVPSQESKRSCICMLGVSILPLSMIFLLDFGTFPIVFFFFLFYWYEWYLSNLSINSGMSLWKQTCLTLIKRVLNCLIIYFVFKSDM